MKLLLDANISWRVAVTLKTHFDNCVHVDAVGLNIPPSDAEIWDFALANSYMIVTNDEDFMNLLNTRGFPPKIVLLKTGNQSNRYLADLLIKHKDSIERLHQSEEYGLLEIY